LYLEAGSNFTGTDFAAVGFDEADEAEGLPSPAAIIGSGSSTFERRAN
jgi:hypothetical protein